MRYEIVVVGPLETNCYLVYCEESRACAIVDPGAEPGKIIAAVAGLELKPALILNTHGHVDHIGANRDMKDKYSVPLYLHAADAAMLEVGEHIELSLLLGAKDSPPPDRLLVDGDTIQVGRVSLKVIHTPGHTPGSVCFLVGPDLLAGDTLFRRSVGRTDLPGGSWETLLFSIQDRLYALPADSVVHPGHGPSTTIGEEMRANPFVLHPTFR